MQQTVSEHLRGRGGHVWGAAIEHRLFREIATDTVSDAVFRRYLSIEFGFIDTAAIVMGYAVAKAPSLDVRRHLSAGLQGLTTDQCWFFAGCLGDDAIPVRPQGADGLHQHFLAVARGGTYVEIIACMLAAEWMYATWCGSAHRNPSRRGDIAAWVALHADAPFVTHVDWMRGQLDAAAEDATPGELDRLGEIFETALAEEILFHDAAYETAG